MSPNTLALLLLISRLAWAQESVESLKDKAQLKDVPVAQIAASTVSIPDAKPQAVAGGESSNFEYVLDDLMRDLGAEKVEDRDEASRKLLELAYEHENDVLFRKAVQDRERGSFDPEVRARLNEALRPLHAFAARLVVDPEVKRGEKLKIGLKIKNISPKDQWYLRRLPLRAKSGWDKDLSLRVRTVFILPGSDRRADVTNLEIPFYPLTAAEVSNISEAVKLAPGQEIDPFDGTESDDLRVLNEWRTREILLSNELTVTLACDGGKDSGKFIWLGGSFREDLENREGKRLELAKLVFKGEVKVEIKP